MFKLWLRLIFVYNGIPESIQSSATRSCCCICEQMFIDSFLNASKSIMMPSTVCLYAFALSSDRLLFLRSSSFHPPPPALRLWLGGYRAARTAMLEILVPLLFCVTCQFISKRERWEARLLQICIDSVCQLVTSDWARPEFALNTVRTVQTQ